MMKDHYNSVEEYIHDIYDNLYPRAKAAADLLLEKGTITKFDFEDKGISPAVGPRAVMDLKEHGIPIDKPGRVHVPQSQRAVVQYKLGKLADLKPKEKYGRLVPPTNLKKRLIEKYGPYCVFCGEKLPAKWLQIDHKLPVKYFGELPSEEITKLDNYQLVCGRCNRLKAEAIDKGCAKTCFKTHDMKVIKSCYWYDPKHYTHVCGRKEGRLSLMFVGDKEIEEYNKIKSIAESEGKTPEEVIKEAVHSLAEASK